MIGTKYAKPCSVLTVNKIQKFSFLTSTTGTVTWRQFVYADGAGSHKGQ